VVAGRDGRVRVRSGFNPPTIRGVFSQHDIIGWIETESDALAATVTTESLSCAVPGCPAWTLRDLTWHLGRVQRFWAGVVRADGDVEPVFVAAEPGPQDADDLGPWMRASTVELTRALQDTPWAHPAWTWWKQPRTVGAIARHQVQEAAVHRWDAQSAVGDPEPLLEPIAADGVEEFLAIAPQMRDVRSITFKAIDLGRSHDLSDAPASATVSGAASDLVLFLYRRRSLENVTIEGDRHAVERFLVPIA